jgi:outer membrane protein TolC
LTSLLPSGLSLTLGGNYAHSSGTRNFLNFDSYKLGTGITLEQPLLRNFWIDQTRWAIRVNKRNLKVSELGVSFLAMSVISLTQQGYYELAFTWENLRVQQSLRTTREELLKGIRRQVELGSMTGLEEKIALAQVAAVQSDLLEASNAVALASNYLRSLLGHSQEDWWGATVIATEPLLAIPETLDLKASWRAGLTQRPDLNSWSSTLRPQS